MNGLSQDKMKKEGRNYARCELQKSSPQPTLNEHKGESDGGVIGRPKKGNRASIKGSK